MEKIYTDEEHSMGNMLTIIICFVPSKLYQLTFLQNILYYVST